MKGLSRDKVFGGLVFSAALIGIAVYTLLLIWFPLLVLQVTAFIAVTAVLAILAWIGWTLATTQPLQTEAASMNPDGAVEEKRD